MKKRLWLVIAGLAMGLSQSVQADTLEQVLQGPQRSAAYKARDTYRHPLQTLEFFGIKPDMTVVEVSPGGGWYTEILAPYLHDEGTYYAAGFDPGSSSSYYRRNYRQFLKKLASDPEVYGKVKVTVFAPPEKLDIAPEGSADIVLTFRNIHNWYMNGGEENLQKALGAFYRALKPGGILGVVEHRLPPTRPDSDQESSGYMNETLVIKMAEKVGFVLTGQSEINANPKDNADHPKGVWTLPPTLRMGDEDRHKYLAIGESDRMTLKFIKPPLK